MTAVLEELEEASQPDMDELNDLCGGMEDCVENALEMKDAVPQAKHQEALSAIMQQLAETDNKLQAERALCEHAHAEVARLKHDLLEAQQGMISKEEHEKIKVRVEGYTVETPTFIISIFHLSFCPRQGHIICFIYQPGTNANAGRPMFLLSHNPEAMILNICIYIQYTALLRNR